LKRSSAFKKKSNSFTIQVAFSPLPLLGKQRGKIMKELPKTITQTMFICMSPYSELPKIVDADMSDCDWATLGTVEVTVDVPQVDPVEKMIEGLEKKAARIEADAYVEVAKVKEKIKQLLSIEHKPWGDV
jgi:hypothetical protein